MSFRYFAFFILIFPISAIADDVSIQLNIGLRIVDRDSQERLPVVGLQLAIGPQLWPIRPTVGASYSLDPVFFGEEIEFTIGAISALRTFSNKNYYWGFGYSNYYTNYSAIDRSSNAGYIQGGIIWPRHSQQFIGINLRMLIVSDQQNDTDINQPGNFLQLNFSYLWH